MVPISSATSGKRQRPRTLLRFSLRSLLIVVTVFAIYLGIRTENARRQQNAVAELRQLGSPVAYDFTYEWTADGHPKIRPGPDGSFNTLPQSNIPQWLIEKLGVDFFHSVVYVRVHAAHKKEVVPFLRELPQLRYVWFPWNGPQDDEALDAMRKALSRVHIYVYPAIVG